MRPVRIKHCKKDVYPIRFRIYPKISEPFIYMMDFYLGPTSLLSHRLYTGGRYVSGLASQLGLRLKKVSVYLYRENVGRDPLAHR